MTVPDALADPTLRRWPLRRRKVATAAGTLSFVVPTSSDEVLNRLGDRADPENLPYWADVWASSLALARRLTRGGRDLSGWRAIDLGCGVGVAGVAAGSLGAEVHFLDVWDDATRFAAFNARANGVVVGGAGAFDWRRDPLPIGSEPARTALLMADLFYEAREHATLHRLVDQVVTGGGVVLAADPGRDVADVWFDAIARDHGAHLESVDTHDGRGRVTVRLATVGELPPARTTDAPRPAETA